ncbi:MAG: hypothetical protein Q7J54_01615 [Candidatus Woesearchaeota archaeon]|nr:hypothetical protein [Candidatus Woesearchaeota archaeon]
MPTTELDLVTIAQILHQDLVEQHGPGQKVAISTIIDQAKHTLGILEYTEGSSQHVLVTMESEGLITRRKKEYMINSAKI